MIRPKLYIDIDGVLLGKKTPEDCEICLAEGADDFLNSALAHFDCYWLTTHAKDGDTEPALRALRPFGDKAFMELARKVKPVRWSTLKTEAIDLKGEFYWFDDQLLQIEREILEKAGRLDRWIKINTRANFEGLDIARRFLVRLIQKVDPIC